MFLKQDMYPVITEITKLQLNFSTFTLTCIAAQDTTTQRSSIYKMPDANLSW